MTSNPTAAVLTLSDQGARGLREDTSGPAVRERLAELGITVAEHALLSDDPNAIAEQTASMGRRERQPDRDHRWHRLRTSRQHARGRPERWIEREASGLAELMRAEGLRKTPMAALSRGICGIAGRTLIVNLPGSERAVRENLDALAPVLPHALQLIGGDTEH